jgi:dTDP-4-amino-4,6-dideoxygalactose transaminase
MTSKPEGGWVYEQIELGYNYRITDIQAAIGIAQFNRLDYFLSRRRELVARYDHALTDLPLTRPWQDPDGRSSHHLYPIRLNLDQIGKTRQEIYDNMRRAGIGVQVHYIPVHLQPYYRKLGFHPGQFREAERYYKETLTLPLHSRLSDVDQNRVVEALRMAIA